MSTVTTITGLDAGTYDVRFIFTGVFGNTDFQYATGFSADDMSQILNAVDAEFYGAVGTTLGFTGDYGSLLEGEATVGSDDELQLFTNILPEAFHTVELNIMTRKLLLLCALALAPILVGCGGAQEIVEPSLDDFNAGEI